MCELLALSFNKEVNASIAFRGFRRRGEENPDGWGFAYYPDIAAQIFKEPIKAPTSDLSEFIVKNKNIQSKIFISHVRYGSKGSISFKNTHPFRRELFAREYVFAHNGTLHNYELLEMNDFHPIGETDSEYIFCYILDKIKENRIKKWTKKEFDWLKNLFSEINDLGKFNCLMSNGELLFCYFDKNGYNGLHYVQRKTPFYKIQLKDEDFEINLAEEKSPKQKGYIVATQPLTNEKWIKFNPGELIVFKGGKIIYS